MSRKSTRAKSSTVSEQSHGKQPLPCKKAAWTLELVKKEEKQPACVIFICGAADRSGRGKCCFLLVVVGGLGELFSDLPCALKMGAYPKKT